MSVRRVAVDEALLERVLTPYFPQCRYLRSAEAVFGGDDAPAVLRGELSIGTSCYIDDTGHFNSVEFNICYNQLIYTLMAQCVVSGVTEPFAAMGLDEYLRRQLPDVLIHDFSSKFRQPMRIERFYGEVRIDEVRDRKRFLFVRTTVRFWDEAGGASEGAVSLAVVDRNAAGQTSRARSGS